MKFDKNIRILIGVVILFFGFIFKSLLGLLGLVPIVFVMIGFCPACYFNKKCVIKNK